MGNVNVVCVNWGTKYSVDYVMRLHQMVKKHTTHNFEMFCLTDTPEAYPSYIKGVRLKPGFEGWWNKMQLFRDDILPIGEYLYFDLDVVIVDNIDCLFEFEGFGITRDFINPETGLLGGKEYNSSIMRFSQNNALWKHFENNQSQWKAAQEKIPFFGDQNVISDFLNKTGFENPFPDDWIWSFKIGTKRGRRPVDHSKFFGAEIPKEGKVCVFHGEPNPDQVNVDWVNKHWKQKEVSKVDLHINEESVFTKKFFSKYTNLMSRIKAVEIEKTFKKPRIAFLGYTDLMLNEKEWLELGVDQTHLINRNNSEKLTRIHGRPDVNIVPTITSAFQNMYKGGFELTVFDFTQYEGSEVEWDFNFPIPEDFHNSFDLIIDNGTCEHIFNIAQAFINIHRMLNVGGFIYHSGPVCWPNHGFYGYNPTLFADFYEDNGCELMVHCMESNFEQNNQRAHLVAENIPKYERFKMLQLLSGNLDYLQLEYNFSTLIRKNNQVDEIKYPIQNKYREKNNWI